MRGGAAGSEAFSSCLGRFCGAGATRIDWRRDSSCCSSSPSSVPPRPPSPAPAVPGAASRERTAESSLALRSSRPPPSSPDAGQPATRWLVASCAARAAARSASGLERARVEGLALARSRPLREFFSREKG